MIVSCVNVTQREGITVSDCSYAWMKIVIKGINSPNGVFSAKYGTIGDQNWSSTPNIVQYYSQPDKHENTATFEGLNNDWGTLVPRTNIENFPFWQEM
jgi:hypothetical protein